ncbi:alginate lyase family protein [Hymenobacter lucidus]|uniref:Alginate lyase family protein n=1 Tax=Hymenobacter lucidus TaxID=2880930 RepID=A0ABS8AXJ7_9BACT|nr:alginate lyase family protein [Hymenobacter lucidus]MCB2410507.1 alginate lyase family protein [Hymenobacter lucidus]
MRTITNPWPVLLVALVLAALAGAAQAAPATPFLLLDPAALSQYRTTYKKGGPAEAQQVKALLTKADQALRHGPYTVTSKQRMPPSGDKHDYISQAPYWWPDPSKPDGKPYIQKDGLVNPETEQLQDDENLAGLCRDVRDLALGYYFSGDEKYAAHAARQLRTFFLDPATRMNPNLNFGQGIPGLNDGRSFGIIESRHLVYIPDALALLSGSKSLTPALVRDLKGWYGQYVQWLTTSKIGQEEGANKNNHGTFHDVQLVDFALFIGNRELARQTLEKQTLPRLPVQFAPDGSQPLELARTRPWNYVSMNLQGWLQLAVLARHAGVDLWQYTSPEGRSLGQAVAWFRPYLLKEKQMERPDAVPAGNTAILTIYNRADREYPALEANKVFAQYPDFVRTPWAI